MVSTHDTGARKRSGKKFRMKERWEEGECEVRGLLHSAVEQQVSQSFVVEAKLRMKYYKVLLWGRMK